MIERNRQARSERETDRDRERGRLPAKSLRSAFNALAVTDHGKCSLDGASGGRDPVMIYPANCLPENRFRVASYEIFHCRQFFSSLQPALMRLAWTLSSAAPTCPFPTDRPQRSQTFPALWRFLRSFPIQQLSIDGPTVPSCCRDLGNLFPVELKPSGMRPRAIRLRLELSSRPCYFMGLPPQPLSLPVSPAFPPMYIYCLHPAGRTGFPQTALFLPRSKDVQSINGTECVASKTTESLVVICCSMLLQSGGDSQTESWKTLGNGKKPPATFSSPEERKSGRQRKRERGGLTAAEILDGHQYRCHTGCVASRRVLLLPVPCTAERRIL